MAAHSPEWQCIHNCTFGILCARLGLDARVLTFSAEASQFGCAVSVLLTLSWSFYWSWTGNEEMTLFISSEKGTSIFLWFLRCDTYLWYNRSEDFLRNLVGICRWRGDGWRCKEQMERNCTVIRSVRFCRPNCKGSLRLEYIRMGCIWRKDRLGGYLGNNILPCGCHRLCRLH